MQQSIQLQTPLKEESSLAINNFYTLYNSKNQLFAIDHEEKCEILQVLPQHLKDQITNYEIDYPLRFNRAQTSSNLSLSLSGLICSVTEKDQLGWAVTQKGLRKGVHYWEVVCPISCDGIQVGVIKKGFDFNAIQNYKELFLLEFKTTTMRTIGIKLDLNKGTLRTWLNGNYNDKKNFGVNGQNVIPEGVWHPMITIKNMGNLVYLNPFGTDPELSQNIKHYEIKEYSQMESLIKEIKQYNFEERNTLPLKENIQFVKASKKNFVFLSGDKIKLLRSGQTFRQQLKRLFEEKPKKLESEVELLISKSDFRILVDSLNWQQLPDRQLNYDFLKCLLLTFSEGDDYCIKAPHALALQQLNQIEEYILNQIQLLENYFDSIANGKFKVEEVDQRNIISQVQQIQEDLAIQELKSLTQQDQQPQNENQKKNKEEEGLLTIQEYYQNLTIVRNLTEQLNGLVTQQYSKYSTYGRLLTFLDHAAPAVGDIIDLAEEGYYMSPGHNCVYNKFHDNIEYDLQFALPRSISLKDKPTFRGNVSLDTTVNCFGFQEVDLQNGRLIGDAPDQNFVGVFFLFESKIVIYNCEVKLIKVAEVNLRKIGPKLLKTKKDILPEVKADTTCDLYKILENYLSVETKALKKEAIPLMQRQQQGDGEDEDGFQADLEMLQQLHLMGFALDLCRKALKKVNNEGVQQALDQVFVLQQEEPAKVISSQPPGKEWSCPDCTLLNKPQNLTCDICGRPAPSEQDLLEFEYEQFQENQIAVEVPQETNVQVTVVEDKQIENFDLEKIITLGDILLIKKFEVCGQIILLCVFELNGQSVIQLKRIQQDVSEYFSEVEPKNPGKGWVDSISNEWVGEKLILSEKQRQIIQGLAHVYSDRSYLLQEAEEEHILIPGKVQDLAFRSINNIYSLFVLCDSIVQEYQLNNSNEQGINILFYQKPSNLTSKKLTPLT